MAWVPSEIAVDQARGIEVVDYAKAVAWDLPATVIQLRKYFKLASDSCEEVVRVHRPDVLLLSYLVSPLLKLWKDLSFNLGHAERVQVGGWEPAGGGFF